MSQVGSKMNKIKLHEDVTLKTSFQDFLFFKNAQGVTNKTISTYETHLKCVGMYLDTTTNISEITKSYIQKMITEMRKRNLSQNSIASYMRTFKAFLTWANNEGLTTVNIPRYKEEETIKETYTEQEIEKLLKKPSLKTSSFAEYRTWVIINFLLNSGARASTVRHIIIRDVDLENGFIVYRHNKNHKIQTIPLCSKMITIFKEYLTYRKGSEEEYLFCNEEGEMLSEVALSSAIKRYNRKRGVRKTSIHLFRHTFAKLYLIECGGDAFTLQRLLGHSTLDMTKHYCNIYNVDLVKNYDSFSPLQNLNCNKKHITLKQD